MSSEECEKTENIKHEGPGRGHKYMFLREEGG
jgi:hypothetical protein